ncbi:MAG TPA: chorismate mutase [Candidatus Gracilibacteria bacterium]|nr:chorismate mutase [Candidatus Gracilibacteria bacterium]
MTKVLDRTRKKIDKIDLKLQKYLSKREVLIKKIKKIKKTNDIKIEDPVREREILKKIKSLYVKKIFKSIIKISKEIQR